MADAWGGAWGASWGVSWGYSSEVAKTGTGGIDPPRGRGRKAIVKPTGIEQRRPTLHLPKKDAKARPTVTERVEDSRALQAEVAAQIARDFATDNAALRQRDLIVPIVSKPLAQMEAEMAALLRKNKRTEEEEVMLLVLLASMVVM